MENMTEKNLPFFARFLDEQEIEQVGGAAAQTMKYPSDKDEGVVSAVTMKYPSDSDEGSVSAVTMKYPSDSDEGGSSL